MKEINFIPSICKGDDAKWKGYVKYRPLNFDEKFLYMDELGLVLGDDGSIDIGPQSNRIKQQVKTVALSEKHYLEVCLERVDGSLKISSFDEMKEEVEMFSTLIEIGLAVISGNRVGNG